MADINARLNALARTLDESTLWEGADAYDLAAVLGGEPDPGDDGQRRLSITLELSAAVHYALAGSQAERQEMEWQVAGDGWRATKGSPLVATEEWRASIESAIAEAEARAETARAILDVCMDASPEDIRAAALNIASHSGLTTRELDFLWKLVSRDPVAMADQDIALDALGSDNVDQ
jgi:hypothetical protein